MLAHIDHLENFYAIKLSILIPSLINRKEYLDKLLCRLKPQLTKEVELVIELDNGQMSTGLKRNLLLAKAEGKYTAFVDDDDLVSLDYIKELMIGIDQNVDVVNILGVHTVDGKNPKLVVDKCYQPWSNTDTYYRGTQHLDAIRSTIAKQFQFPDITFGEDKIWSEKVEASKLIKTYCSVNHPVYFHQYRNKGGQCNTVTQLSRTGSTISGKRRQ